MRRKICKIRVRIFGIYRSKYFCGTKLAPPPLMWMRRLKLGDIILQYYNVASHIIISNKSATYLFIYPSIHQSIYLISILSSIYPSIYASIYPSIYLSILSKIYLISLNLSNIYLISVHPSIHQSIRLYIYLTSILSSVFYLSICLSDHLSLYPAVVYYTRNPGF